MLDTHAVARSLTAADFTPAQADALTDALREFTERGDHVTPDQFKVGLAEVRTEIAELRSEVRTEIANLDTRLSAQIGNVRTPACRPRSPVSAPRLRASKPGSSAGWSGPCSRRRR